MLIIVNYLFVVIISYRLYEMRERVIPRKVLLVASGVALFSPIFAPNLRPKIASAPIPENVPICFNLNSQSSTASEPDFLNMQKNTIESDWTKKESPTMVYIPKLNYADNLKPMNIIPDGNGGNTLQTPDEGLGTPEKPLADIVFIYGHSWWEKEQNPISQIDKLEHGDVIIIENITGERLSYAVSEYRLYNYEDPKFTLDDMPDSALVIQTTAIIGNQWLIDEQKVKSDLWPFIPENISDHAAFLVIATPEK